MAQEETVNYEAILRDLQTRRRAVAEKRERELNEFDAAMVVIHKLTREGTAQEVPPSATVEPSVYADVTLAEAVHHFLETAGEPKPARAIVRGIENGGYVTQSKKFYNIVYNRLVREASQDRVYRKNGRWGLPSWRTADGGRP